MSRSINRRNLAVGCVALTAMLVPAVGNAHNAHAAKSHKVNMKLVGRLSGVTITGTANGTPFGNCKNKATLIIPRETQTWTCPKGKVKISSVGTTGAANAARGNWKITGGTGAYKHAKGKGTFSGLQSTGKFTYVGTASF